MLGRVSPDQKRAAVRLLKERGRTVAMTGDGVNDAMAVKDADLGIAMGSGTAATKAVSRVVLLDDRFDRLPDVLASGRRVIANVERVSNIFLAKTTYGILLALVSAVLLWPFPFLPRQLTLVSTLAIGIPSFFLALAPNKRIYTPGVLGRVLRYSVPTGLIAGRDRDRRLRAALSQPPAARSAQRHHGRAVLRLAVDPVRAHEAADRGALAAAGGGRCSVRSGVRHPVHRVASSRCICSSMQHSPGVWPSAL